jgi:hypothetical protein
MGREERWLFARAEEEEERRREELKRGLYA